MQFISRDREALSRGGSPFERPHLSEATGHLLAGICLWLKVRAVIEHHDLQRCIWFDFIRSPFWILGIWKCQLHSRLYNSDCETNYSLSYICTREFLKNVFQRKNTNDYCPFFISSRLGRKGARTAFVKTCPLVSHGNICMLWSQCWGILI